MSSIVYHLQPKQKINRTLDFGLVLNIQMMSNTDAMRELSCPYLDSKTSSTIAASIVHSKLDYCNSHYYNLPKSQINRLQQIQNCLARAVVKAPKSSHVTPILRSLHWLKINKRIEYKLLSLTKFLQPANLTTYTILSLFSLQVDSLFVSCHPSSTIRIFLITNHQLLFHTCITLPVESAPFFIPSTSFCSLSSWFTSSCAYHLITDTPFTLITYHCL